MRIKGRICDICGSDTLVRRNRAYIIKSRYCFIDSTFHKMDLCQDCYKQMVAYIKDRNAPTIIEVDKAESEE